MPDAKSKRTKPETVEGIPRGRDRRNLSTGSPAMIQRHVWAAMRKASDILDDPSTPPDVALRAVHAISGASNAWNRAHEQYQLQQDVADLRQTVERIVAERQAEGRYPSPAADYRQNTARGTSA